MTGKVSHSKFLTYHLYKIWSSAFSLWWLEVMFGARVEMTGKENMLLLPGEHTAEEILSYCRLCQPHQQLPPSSIPGSCLRAEGTLWAETHCRDSDTPWETRTPRSSPSTTRALFSNFPFKKKKVCIKIMPSSSDSLKQNQKQERKKKGNKGLHSLILNLLYTISSKFSQMN